MKKEWVYDTILLIEERQNIRTNIFKTIWLDKLYFNKFNYYHFWSTSSL